MALFQEDFEGCASPWGFDGVNGTPVCTSAVKHHGTYCGEFEGGEYATKTFSQTTLYAFFAFMIDTLPVDGEENRLVDSRGTDGRVLDIYYRRRDAAGGLQLFCDGLGGAPDTAVLYSWVINTWYEMKIKWVVNDAANGEYKVWVDGSLEVDQTGFDWSARTDITTFNVGQYLTDYAHKTRVDCCVLDISDIASDPFAVVAFPRMKHFGLRLRL